MDTRHQFTYIKAIDKLRYLVFKQTQPQYYYHSSPLQKQFQFSHIFDRSVNHIHSIADVNCWNSTKCHELNLCVWKQISVLYYLSTQLQLPIYLPRDSDHILQPYFLTHNIWVKYSNTTRRYSQYYYKFCCISQPSIFNNNQYETFPLLQS